MSQTALERIGDFRSPRNLFSGAGGSIHNDAVASKLGFKGGTVAGSIHMDQFVPLLLDIYGDAWFEHGDISTYFTQATVDNERVRATAIPDHERTRLRLHNEVGDLILEGTASLAAPDPRSELSRRMAMQEPAAEGRLRILGEFRIGDEHHDLPVRIEHDGLDRARSTITEDLAAYRDDRILPPSQVVHLAHMTRSAALAQAKRAVGLFGALQVQQVRGPLRAGVDYLARTKILKLTESPRTENVWYDVTFETPINREVVGSMLYCLRFMKGSSPLWEADAGSVAR